MELRVGLAVNAPNTSEILRYTLNVHGVNEKLYTSYATDCTDTDGLNR